jgi:hypothetical protein
MLTFLFIGLIPFPGITQINTHSISSRYQSMGNASVALRDEQSLMSNPAGLMGTQKISFTLQSAWLYGVNDLKPVSVGAVIPNPSGTFGLLLNHLGFENLQENTLGLSYARRFSDKLDAGIGLKYANYKINTYGSKGVLGFDIGFNTLIFKDFYLGFHAQNPIPTQSNDVSNSANIPVMASSSIFRLGLSYRVNNLVLLNTEVKKDLSYPAAFRFGLEYKPIEKIAFRGGFETQPVKIAFGMGYIISNTLSVDMAISSHSVLGVTPSLSINYFLKK